MEIKINSRTDNKAELTVTVDEKTLSEVVQHTYDELRPSVKAAGFRPGKAPNNIVEREIGANRIQSEVIDHALQLTYTRAMRQEQLNVIAPPQVSVEKFVPYTELEYKVEVELMPPVKLADYRKYRLKRPQVVVDPNDVDKTLDELRRREAVRLESDHAAKSGDEVNFDFDGTRDGKPVRGASAKGQTLQLGSNQFIPGFEDELIGLKKDDEKTFDIRFPDSYHEKSLAGEVITFKVKINSVTDLVLPEVNEEFVGKISPFKTVDELKNDILMQLADRQNEQAARQYETAVLDWLIKESKFEAPKPLVKQQLARMHEELEQNLTYSGLDLHKYLEVSKKTLEELDAELEPEAARRVGLAMLLTEVGEAEKITVTAEELDAEIAKLKSRYKDEVAQSQLDTAETREELYNNIMGSRVVAKLVDYAEGK